MTSPILGPAEILKRLNAKFSRNLQSAVEQESAKLSDLEIRARVLGEFGSLLRANECSTTPTQEQLTNLPEEMFADVVSSIYLAAIGLAKPAHTTLRRAVELGLALVYLWDLPHAFWAWKECDQDLSFSEMLEHLDSPGYRSFLAHEVGVPVGAPLFDAKRLRTVYRTTSNTTHGKISTHKVLLSDGFSHIPAEWSDCLDLLDSAIAEVVRLWFNRYPKTAEQVRQSVPAYDHICSC